MAADEGSNAVFGRAELRRLLEKQTARARRLQTRVHELESLLTRKPGQPPRTTTSERPFADEAPSHVRFLSFANSGDTALDFLMRASNHLSGSLDYAETLRNIATIIVPEFADFCSLYLARTGGGFELGAARHANPERTPLLHEDFRHLQADGALSSARVGRVMQSGVGELWARIGDRELSAWARNDAHLAALRQLAPSSLLCVPLYAQNTVLGSLAMARSDSAAPYTPADFALAEELARRAALAIDHSRLFEMAQRERLRVEEANRAKDEFLAMVSHELRTPLNAILGWTRMLRTGALDHEQAQKAMAVIERNAEAQTQLIEDLLDISRIITGKLRLNVSRVELAQTIAAAVDTLRPAADNKQLRLDVALDPEVGSIPGDPDRVQQVVWNLVSNAVKFTPGGGSVNVRLGQDETNIELSVEDSGRGIPPAFLGSVFDRFRQLETGASRTQGGLGLGLSIVRHLVELHGGTVHAESDGEGRGARFVVRFPKAASERTRALSPPPERRVERLFDGFACAPELVGLRVLVVDDEADSRELVAALLGQCKVAVDTAVDAEEALRAFCARPCDVIISDIGLPGEDGYTFIQHVRALPDEQGKKVRAIALTARARVEDRTRALLSGFDMHVAKPVDPTELMAVLTNVSARKRAQ